VVSALLIRGMRFTEAHAENMPPFRARDLVGYAPIAEGFRYVRADSRRFVTLFAKAGIGLMGTNWVILPLMGEKIFPLRLNGFDERQAGTMGMSILLASRGLGALIGGFTAIAYAGNSERKLRTAIFAGFVFGGLGYLTLAGAPSIFVAVAALVIAHAGGSGIWVASTTLLQQITEDRFRGRVFSAEFALMMLTVGSTGYIAGFAVDHGIGIRTMAFLTGLAVLCAAVAWSYAQRHWSSRGIARTRAR
jgi:hypothetical protein